MVGGLFVSNDSLISLNLDHEMCGGEPNCSDKSLQNCIHVLASKCESMNEGKQIEGSSQGRHFDESCTISMSS